MLAAKLSFHNARQTSITFFGLQACKQTHSHNPNRVSDVSFPNSLGIVPVSSFPPVRKIFGSGT